MKIARIVAMQCMSQCILTTKNASSMLVSCLTTNRFTDQFNFLLGISNQAKCLTIVCGLFLSGCQPHSPLKDDLQEYRERLANVLDVDAAVAPEIPGLDYPSVRTLKADIPDLTINLSEFYALQDCPVATLIAERNTALGRVQLPSTRYIYEVKLLQGLNDCLQRANTAQMQEQLRIWIEHKRMLLPLTWVNLLQLSTEVKHAFSFNQGYLHGDASDNASASFSALEYLISLQQNPIAEPTVLETHLQQLKHAILPARIWRSQRLLTSELEATTNWLNANEQKTQCFSPADEQKVAYLNNVFTLYFIEKIQPIAGKLNQYQYRLIPLLKKIQSTPHIDPELQALLASYEADFVRYKSAMSDHVSLWQRVLTSCNLAPQQTR